MPVCFICRMELEVNLEDLFQKYGIAPTTKPPLRFHPECVEMLRKILGIQKVNQLKPIRENIEEHTRQDYDLRKEIVNAITRWPDNPRIKRVPGLVNAFVISSKDVRQNISVFHHDFEAPRTQPWNSSRTRGFSQVRRMRRKRCPHELLRVS